MAEHKDILSDGAHVIHYWEVADSTALSGLTPTIAELNKIALKVDDNTFWQCTKISPATFKLLNEISAEDIKTKYESNSDTNALTDALLTLLTTKKVKNITTDAVNNKLVITYTDDTVANLNISDMVTDVHVSGATLDATTNVLTLTSTEGGADVTVDLSDFVNSGELTSALSGKADKIHSHSTSNITGLDAILSNKVTKNAAIIGATKTKITYDSNGLVTGGADLVEADLPNISQSKIINLVSDLSNKQSSLISGTNIKTINGQSVLGSGDIVITGGGSVQLTGNQTIAGIKTFSSNIVGNITGNSDTATKLATARTIGGVPFDGTANINLPGVNAAGNQNTTGNAGSATKLATARTINGVAFDGSANITVSDDTKLTKTNPSIIGSITEQVYSLTGEEINPANGTIQYKTVSANTTFTETLISGQSVLLRLINATSYTITFPTITWVGADAPILTANCAIALWKEQSTLYGAYIGTLI